SVERTELEAVIRGAGEVQDVVFEDATSVQPLARPGQVVTEAPRAVQVRVDQRRLDEIADGIGELSLLERRLRQELGDRAGSADAVSRLSALLSDLQHAVLSVRMVQLGEAFERFPRVVRDAARRAEKEVDFRVQGEGIEIDRSILDDVVDPLLHLLRNAVDHGIEPEAERVAAGKPARGSIVLRAERARASVRIALEDDGRGVARERVLEKARLAGLAAEAEAAAHDDDALLRLMAHPGLSTAEQVTELSGRGVGLDVVLSRVRALGGAIDMSTEPGRGTTFTLRLPITLALARALLVRVDGEEYAVPLTHISEAIELEGAIERRTPGGEYVKLREEALPLVRMTRVLGSRHVRTERAAIVAELGQRRIALGFDEIVGHEQILVKTFDAAAGTLPIFSGATLLADGRPALVLDPLSVI
ncbi:MAG TPA: chemotaxis protein CheW, partial [Longimicrobiales bacterium]|nr:chemotaxis protein CheW [Longimicrobiales bacterium]